MIGFVLFLLAVLCSAAAIAYQKKRSWQEIIECFLGFFSFSILGHGVACRLRACVYAG